MTPPDGIGSEAPTDRPSLKALGGVFVSAAGIITAVPGLNAALDGVAMPPGRAALFGAVPTLLGALAILLLAANRDRFVPAGPSDDVRRRTMVAWCIGLVVLTAVAASLYTVAYNATVFKDVTAEGEPYPLYLPLFPGGDLGDMVERAGGRLEAIYRYSPYVIGDEVAGQPVRMAITDAALLVLLSVAVLAIVSAFALAGWGLWGVEGEAGP